MIETLITMALLTISTLFLMKCMIMSLAGIKNSNLRFKVAQILENKKSTLLGIKTGSPVLYPGERIESDSKINVRIKITDVSEGLKKITLEGSDKGYTLISVFYRSEKIREGENE